MKYVSTVVALAVSLSVTSAITTSAQEITQDKNAAVAQIGGTKITAADFENKEAGALLQARYQMYLSQRKALDKYVDQQILETQAKKEGLTVDQLLEKEAYKDIKEPSDDQLEVFYEGLKAEQPFSQVKDQIRDHVRETRRAKAKADYLKTLKAQTSVRVLLASPTANVDIHDSNVRGSKKAPVTLVEFADFECPYCAKVNPTLIEIQKEYGNKLAMVFKDFPLPMHKDAQKAAESARCAGEQGKYWEYHDLLFANNHDLDVPSLKKHAGELKLDQAKFDSCLDTAAEAAAVKKDADEGQRLGISGTPSFFVNGHFFSGAADSTMLHEFIGMEMPAGVSAAAPSASIAQAAGKK